MLLEAISNWRRVVWSDHWPEVMNLKAISTVMICKSISNYTLMYINNYFNMITCTMILIWMKTRSYTFYYKSGNSWFWGNRIKMFLDKQIKKYIISVAQFWCKFIISMWIKPLSSLACHTFEWQIINPSRIKFLLGLMTT